MDTEINGAKVFSGYITDLNILNRYLTFKGTPY